MNGHDWNGKRRRALNGGDKELGIFDLMWCIGDVVVEVGVGVGLGLGLGDNEQNDAVARVVEDKGGRRMVKPK